MTNFVNSKYTVTNLEVKANDNEIRGGKREGGERVVRAEGIVVVVMVFVLVVNVFVVAITTITIITNSPFVTYGIVVVCHVAKSHPRWS